MLAMASGRASMTQTTTRTDRGVMMPRVSACRRGSPIGRNEVYIMAAMKFSVGGTGGLNWQGHVDAAAACEELGYHGFFPSDHLMPIVDRGGDQDRLDAPSTLLALSGRTSRIRLGCM